MDWTKSMGQQAIGCFEKEQLERPRKETTIREDEAD